MSAFDMIEFPPPVEDEIEVGDDSWISRYCGISSVPSPPPGSGGGGGARTFRLTTHVEILVCLLYVLSRHIVPPAYRE